MIPAPRKDCGPCALVCVVSVFHHPHISTPSSRLVRHASKRLEAGEQAALVISCTQKFNLKGILGQQRGHVTTQRMNESQLIQIQFQSIAKESQVIFSNFSNPSIWHLNRKNAIVRWLRNTTGAPNATMSAAFPALFHSPEQPGVGGTSWRLNLRADVHQLNTLFSKAFRNQGIRLFLSYVILFSV